MKLNREKTHIRRVRMIHSGNSISENDHRRIGLQTKSPFPSLVRVPVARANSSDDLNGTRACQVSVMIWRGIPTRPLYRCCWCCILPFRDVGDWSTTSRRGWLIPIGSVFVRREIDLMRRSDPVDNRLNERFGSLAVECFGGSTCGRHWSLRRYRLGFWAAARSWSLGGL